MLAPGAIGPTWTCDFQVAAPSGAFFRLLRDPISGQAGISYSVPTNLSVSGALIVRQNGATDLYNWSAPAASGTYLLGKSYSGSVGLEVFVYNSDLVTTDPRLAGGHISEAWSMSPADDLWVVRHVHVGGRDFLFEHETTLPSGGNSTVATFQETHDGYRTLFHLGIFLGTENAAVRIAAPDPACLESQAGSPPQPN